MAFLNKGDYYYHRGLFSPYGTHGPYDVWKQPRGREAVLPA